MIICPHSQSLDEYGFSKIVIIFQINYPSENNPIYKLYSQEGQCKMWDPIFYVSSINVIEEINVSILHAKNEGKIENNLFLNFNSVYSTTKTYFDDKLEFSMGWWCTSMCG